MEQCEINRYRAYGKINLALSVLGKRKDGYHEVVTLMVPVGLFDVLLVEKVPQGLEVICPQMPDLPHEQNLVYKAARAFMSQRSVGFGLKITIEKNIPPGSGMGGGSSDAAAALLAINDLLESEKRTDRRFLLEIAAQIGSDVPFFLGCNACIPLWRGALCTGKGDQLKGINPPSYWVVLVTLKVHVNTAWAYSQWDVFCSRSEPGGDSKRVDKTMQALFSKDPQVLGMSLFNDLEEGVCAFHKEIAQAKKNLVLSGAFGACMTGSGSAVYGICGSCEHAKEVKEKFLGISKTLPVDKAIVTKTGV